MTYTTHADALFDPDKPILGATHLEARDNLIAVAAGDTNAPKIAVKVASAVGATIDFTGLGDFDGIQIDFNVFESGGVGTNIQAALSTDGTTFSTASTIATIPSGQSALGGTCFIELDTGWTRCQYGTPASAGHAGPTLAGASSSVVAVRLSATAGTVTIAALANPNGGRTIT